MAGLSAAADGELADGRAAALEAHLAGCPACAAFRSRLVTLRQHLRFEPVGTVPDVAPRVLTAIRAGRPEPLRSGRGRGLPVVAAFLCGVVLGATFIGLGRGGPGQVAMADLPARVVAAQRTLGSLAADVSLVERGWHPRVPEALAADPGLRRPRDLRGFAPPAVRVDGRTVTLAYPGPGSRGRLLVQAPGDRLAPPLDDDPAGVRVRGTDGRWSPARGELE
jgi:hypothetical protein